MICRYSVLLLVLLLTGCSTLGSLLSFARPATVPASHIRESVIDRVGPTVQNLLRSTTHDAHLAIVAAHHSVDNLPARYKRRSVTHALKNPWEGLRNLEAQGRFAAELATGGAVTLPALLDRLEAGMDGTSVLFTPLPLPTSQDLRDTIAFMVDTVHQASLHRDQALAALSDQEQAFLFSHGQSLAELYSPQISVLSDHTMAQIAANAKFVELLAERVDYGQLLAAGQVLVRLVNDRWLNRLADAFPHAASPAHIPPGITGEVLFIQHTPDGLIVIGGLGPNSYELDGEVALVLDLGGDDEYRGFIGASRNTQHGNAVVIDLAGNDRYTGAPLGLATGRLGVGLLFDRAGNDTYQLALGSGGAGIGGVGILFDMQGNDRYIGNRLSQGAALGGVGLLVDVAGHDQYSSHGFALGFGGPLGVGALIDVEGDDHYHCGDVVPSAYNAQEAPQAKPGDPLFQYDCFGLGVGAGSRVLTKRPEWRAQSLAGGLGLLMDLKGQDRYQSANFSQGMGYFFGAGVFLDLDGNDHYGAARYGHGASAHHGVALFIDHQGDDHYGSTGPYYNAGVAWDHGVSLTIDAGTGRDIYALDRTTGLGKADYTGWAVFVEEGGDDHYTIQSGFGNAAEQSLAGFIDLSGNDRYTVLSPSSDSPPADGTSRSPAPGSFFEDR